MPTATRISPLPACCITGALPGIRTERIQKRETDLQGRTKGKKTKVLNSPAILQAGAKKRYPKLMAMILPNLDDFQDFDHWKIFKSKFADKCYC